MRVGNSFAALSIVFVFSVGTIISQKAYNFYEKLGVASQRQLKVLSNEKKGGLVWYQ